MRVAPALHLNMPSSNQPFNPGMPGSGFETPTRTTAGSCTPITRTMSGSSINSVHSNASMPLTPMGQMIPTPTKIMFHRLNSVSSIATSDDEEINSNSSFRTAINPIDSFSDWPTVDDDLLMNVYHAHIDNPTVAPFAGKIPPSGIVHRVARDTVRQARSENKVFSHSLSAIRKRLLLLCSRRASAGGGGVHSPQLHSTQSFETSLIYGEPLGYDYKEQFVFDDANNFQNSGIPIQGEEYNMDTDMHDPLDDSRVSQWLLTSTPESLGRMDARGSDLFPPTPNSISNSTFAIPLASPFHEQPVSAAPTSLSSPFTSSPQIAIRPNHLQPTPKLHAAPVRRKYSVGEQTSPTPEREDPFINYTAQRKRDSLRLKRGLKTDK